MKKLLIISLAALLLSGCVEPAPLEEFQTLCEETHGIYLDCATAFAQICSHATTIEGQKVACSCKEGTAWHPEQGCR